MESRRKEKRKTDFQSYSKEQRATDEEAEPHFAQSDAPQGCGGKHAYAYVHTCAHDNVLIRLAVCFDAAWAKWQAASESEEKKTPGNASVGFAAFIIHISDKALGVQMSDPD